MYFLVGCILIVCIILYMVFYKVKNDVKDLFFEMIEEIEYGLEL